MDVCPITGAPCSNPKIIHITDVGLGYTAEKAYDLCQVCTMGKMQPKPQEVSPIVKNIFELLKLLITTKIKSQVQEPPPQSLPITTPPVALPSCPGCGMTPLEIIHAKRLGCSQCYDFFKNELMPVIVRIHKATEHTGKHPKHKNAIMDNMPIAEQVKLVELQMKQAVDQEQYEKANELKNKLALLKANLPL